MKKIFLALVLVQFSLALHASGYPEDFGWQKLKAQSDGPALVSYVSSGIMSKVIIGYRKYGSVAGKDYVDAVIMAECLSPSGLEVVHIGPLVVRLGKEWHGAGYMSSAISPMVLDKNCAYPKKISVAFTYGGEWDSKEGRNYSFDLEHIPACRTSKEGGPDVNLKLWDFLVNELATRVY